MTNNKGNVSSPNDNTVTPTTTDDFDHCKQSTNHNENSSVQEISDTSDKLYFGDYIQGSLEIDGEEKPDDKAVMKLSQNHAIESTFKDHKDDSDGVFAVENASRYPNPSKPTLDPTVASSPALAEITQSCTGRHFAQSPQEMIDSDFQLQILQRYEELQQHHQQEPQMELNAQHESDPLHLQYHAILMRRQQDRQQWIQQYLSLENIRLGQYHDIYQQNQQISSDLVHQQQTKSSPPPTEQQPLQPQQNRIAGCCQNPSNNVHESLSVDTGESHLFQRRLETTSRSKLEIINQKDARISSSQYLQHQNKHQIIDFSSDTENQLHELVEQQLQTLEENQTYLREGPNHHRYECDEKTTKDQTSSHHFLIQHQPQNPTESRQHQLYQAPLDKPSQNSAEESPLSAEEHMDGPDDESVLPAQQEQQQPSSTAVVAEIQEPLTGLVCYNFVPSTTNGEIGQPQNAIARLLQILSISQSKQNLQHQNENTKNITKTPTEESTRLIMKDVLQLVRRTPFELACNDRGLSMSKVAALPKLETTKTRETKSDQTNVSRSKRQSEHMRDELDYSSDSSVDSVRSKSRKRVKQARSNLKRDWDATDQKKNSREGHNA